MFDRGISHDAGMKCPDPTCPCWALVRIVPESVVDVEGLDALPDGSVLIGRELRNGGRNVYVKAVDTEFAADWYVQGVAESLSPEVVLIDSPLTVLYRPVEVPAEPAPNDHRCVSFWKTRQGTLECGCGKTMPGVERRG